jgi:mRNA interferase MazF
MSIYPFGAVVLVAFPFSDQSATKQRPAVVISSAAYQRERPDLIILAITSQVRTTHAFGESTVHDWQAAGLVKPSALKPLVTTIETRLVRKVLGTLSTNDQQRLKEIIAATIG